MDHSLREPPFNAFIRGIRRNLVLRFSVKRHTGTIDSGEYAALLFKGFNYDKSGHKNYV